MAPPTWADIAVGIMRIAATAPIIESLPSRIQASLGCGCRCRSRRANIIGLGSGARHRQGRYSSSTDAINRISGSPVRRQAGAIVFGPTMFLCGDTTQQVLLPKSRLRRRLPTSEEVYQQLGNSDFVILPNINSAATAQ